MRYKIGTLVEDRGLLGMISAVLPKGYHSDTNGYHKINWRDNYEIQYADDTVYIIGTVAFHRLVTQGQIRIIKGDTALSPSR